MIKAENIKLVDINHLVLNPKNNNKHPKEQIDRLIKLIEFQGFRNPVIVSNRTGFVVAGHGRIEAAKKIKMKQVPVIYQDFDSEAQEYAYMTSDNAIASWAELDLSMVNTEMMDLGPDFDIDMLGIKDFVIEPIEKFEPQADEDDVPEVVHAIARKGDLWILGNHRLLCGDSTMIDDVERLMGGEKADMVFTDPPYGISIVKNNKVGASNLAKTGHYVPVAGDENIDVAEESIQVIQVLKPAIQIIWGGNYYANKLANSSCWIVWDKRDGMAGNNFADCELAWTNMKTATRMISHRWSGMLKASEKGEKRVHPTQKPVALAEWCIKEYGENCETVLDMFGGSGFTLIAGEKLGKRTFIMELSEHYCDTMIKRWEQYTGKKAVLESTNQTYEELKAERDGTT
jgi:DNA modification methylase